MQPDVLLSRFSKMDSCTSCLKLLATSQQSEGKTVHTPSTSVPATGWKDGEEGHLRYDLGVAVGSLQDSKVYNEYLYQSTMLRTTSYSSEKRSQSHRKIDQIASTLR